MEAPHTRRILLVGKTGVGKSSLANIIFGEKLFTISHTLNSETNECTSKTKTVNGKHITLIDTPGLYDPGRSEGDMKAEMVRCTTECAPGPHAFLIVLKVEKFTEHEKAVITRMCEHFSEEALTCATVVFTHGDQLTEVMKIEEYVDQSEGLRDLVKRCGGRCHVVDNKYWKSNQEDEYRSNKFQVTELLNTIEQIVIENKGKCYTNKMLQAVENEIQKEEEHIRRFLLNKTEEEIRQQAKDAVFKKTLRVVMYLAAVVGLLATASKPKRIVILGKTGSGKSSLANTLFGQQLFTINHTQNSKTRQCQAQTQSVHGREITLIDTPGFFDTDRCEEKLMPEIVKCITECSAGPHAFLLVFKVEKCTKHEKAVISKICEYFSEEVFKYATVLFTHGDQLPEGQIIQDFVRQNEFTSDLVKRCGGRCHVFDNKYWNKASEGEYRSNRFQVEELLKTIDKTVEENQGGCYTNDMLQAVEESIRQEEQRIRERSGNMSEEEIREQAKVNVCEKLLIIMAGVATGMLLGAFFGAVVMVGMVATLLRSSSESVKLREAIAKTTTAAAKAVAATGAVGAIGGAAAFRAIVGATVTATFIAAGAVRGGIIGYAAAEGAATAGEAAKKTVEAVKSEAQSVLDKTNEALNRPSMTETEEKSKINDPTESGKT